MFTENVKFKDLDGNPVEQTWEFNISTAEMTKMELGMKGGLKKFFERIINEDDRPAIVESFDKVLLASVGKRSSDNKLFLKTPEVVNEFRYSGAYEVMFLRLLTDAEYSAKFVSKIFPEDMIEKLNASKPVAVDLPASPVSLTPNLNTASPDFSRMTDADFAAWRLRQNSPLGL